ncbi:hypothetical protein EJB05_25532, partial [Eragrostis curvula]
MASSFTARPRANNAAAATQLLSSSRVITPTDDEKKPLWRYIELLEKTGKGQGGNTKSRCRLCNHTFHGSYARVKAHLLHIGGFGISSCTAVTVHVLEQLRDEVAKAQAVVARDMPRNIPLPTEGERTHVERMLQPIKSTWSSKGVSVVSDGWSDAQRRPLLNFLAVTEDGPMFLKAINTEGEIKKKEYIAEKMLAVIDEIGAHNVVQVITDNAANCKAAGFIVEQKHPHIFWTPCGAEFLQQAQLSLDEPDLERIVEDLGTLGISDNVEQSSPPAAVYVG